MDIERFKRLSIPKIEAGKMTEVVRDVIKEVETRDQDLYEKVAKDLKPLTEKFDKEIEEISKLREDVNKQVIPYGEQVQRLALPGPKEGAKTLKVGQGIYTQKKRNSYMINPNTGVYGNVTIDVPKLYGQLKLIAHKDGKKVYDKQADFDTLDLLTKRFNSKKKYSPLSKMVFDDLNRISDIPIHRTSNKYKKIGAGVVYYNNPVDLLDRLELLGGSILAGNNGVKNEFSKIAHTLNKLGVLNNNQLNSLLKEYVI
ncbi:unnamed protein product [Porites lobata]|uniref:Uncharacterized protein n=1 Tax=Porites lobata TaxID=104759 RepID=A0ABN8S154_9CNID|nr:unnamed protein product [Porites lobata]